jgi:hypothetical protein
MGGLSLEMTLWLMPILFVVHDGEEVLTWEWWVRQEKGHMFNLGGAKQWHCQTWGEMLGAVSFVGLIVLAATASAVSAVREGGSMALFAGFLAVWTGHVIAHVAATVRHRMYTPGVITAVLVCLPYGLYAYHRLFAAGKLTVGTALSSGIVALLLTPVLLPIAHGFGVRLKRMLAG